MVETRRRESFDPLYHVESPVPPTKPKSSNLEKFLEGIRQLFSSQEKNKKDTHFSSIQKLQVSANKILTELKTTKDLLEATTDEELFLHIKTIVALLEQSISSLNDMLKEPHEVTHQVHVSELYMRWMAKAKSWNERLTTNSLSRQEIITSAICEICEERIERDIRSIRNYPSYQEAQKWQSQLEPLLANVLDKLQQLKKLPEQQTPENIKKWKITLDTNRAKYYNEALKTIDKILGLEGPAPL